MRKATVGRSLTFAALTCDFTPSQMECQTVVGVS